MPLQAADLLTALAVPKDDVLRVGGRRVSAVTTERQAARGGVRPAFPRKDPLPAGRRFPQREPHVTVSIGKRALLAERQTVIAGRPRRAQGGDCPAAGYFAHAHGPILARPH